MDRVVEAVGDQQDAFSREAARKAIEKDEW
jgi:hypothetical protein